MPFDHTPDQTCLADGCNRRRRRYRGTIRGRSCWRETFRCCRGCIGGVPITIVGMLPGRWSKTRPRLLRVVCTFESYRPAKIATGSFGTLPSTRRTDLRQLLHRRYVYRRRRRRRRQPASELDRHQAHQAVTTPRNQSKALAPACLSMRLRRTHPRLDRRKVSRASQRRRSR